MPRTHTHRRLRPLGLLLAASALALGPLAGSAATTPSPEATPAETTAESTEAAEVVLEAALEPQNVFSPPSAVVPIDATVTNTGTADLTGSSTSFEVTGDDVTITGIEGGDGCEQVTTQRVECHTDATLAPGESAMTTFLVKLPDRMAEVVVGEATDTSILENTGGDELADTGTARLPVLLAGAVLLAAGGALLLRTRRT